MKSSYAIALVVCGTVLVLTPFLTDMISVGMVAETMRAMPGHPINLTGSLPPGFNWAAIFIGAAMIVASLIASLAKPKSA